MLSYCCTRYSFHIGASEQRHWYRDVNYIGVAPVEQSGHWSCLQWAIFVKVECFPTISYQPESQAFCFWYIYSMRVMLEVQILIWPLFDLIIFLVHDIARHFSHSWNSQVFWHKAKGKKKRSFPHNSFVLLQTKSYIMCPSNMKWTTPTSHQMSLNRHIIFFLRRDWGKYMYSLFKVGHTSWKP